MKTPVRQRILEFLFGSYMRVTADRSGRWQLLRRWGRDHFEDRDQAVQAGLHLARNRRVRRLVVEREDGSTQEEIYFW